MQNNYWTAASAKSDSSGERTATQNIKQISLVIIRLELDNCNENDPINRKELSSERDIYNIFNYHSAAYYSKQRSSSIKETSLSDYSEKTNQEDLLKLFIGKRQSHLIRIETYDFNEMNANKNSQGQNSLTMQSALETAYSDWNKTRPGDDANISDEKPVIVDNNEDNNSVKTENTQSNQQDTPQQEQSKETNQKSTETSNDPKKEDNKGVDELQTSNEPSKASETSKEDNKNEEELTSAKITSSKTENTKSKKSKKHQDEKGNNKEEKPPSPIIKQSDSDTTEISFYYGNPTVDIVKGFLHIYKDTTLTPLIDDVHESKMDSKVTGFSPKQSTLVPSNRSEMLCMIGIPANVGCNELLDFIMPFNETIDYMRIVRDNSPNQYMALIKFKNQKDTDSFYLHNNNRLFNSIEDSVCHLVFVERIEAMNSSKGASLPIPGFTELPTCYICLERMDESLNGVITILCNHSFHTNCLSKWGDTCCPVCRYSQTPEYELDNMCSECGSHENLWICLICGHVGCGRYVRGHAYNHFQLTQHTYSMQMGNNRVWDYAADNYVHRLIQNKTDGKLVQLDEGGRVINQDEKIDSITLEYTYLLTTQLESQRLFFEEKMQIIEDKYKSQIIDLEAKTKQLESENSELKQNQSQMSKEKANIEKKCSTLSTKLSKMQADLEEEKEMNKCLSSNQEVYQGKLVKMEENLKKLSHEKDSEIAELKSQLKDIMFYLDAQSKIAESKDVTKEEIDQSQLVIQQNQAAASNASESQNRRGKKKK